MFQGCLRQQKGPSWRRSQTLIPEVCAGFLGREPPRNLGQHGDTRKMKIATTKISDGNYRVIIDGRTTNLIVGRGDPPKYREPQVWSIGEDKVNHVEWLADEQRGKRGALHTIERIITAAKVDA